MRLPTIAAAVLITSASYAAATNEQSNDKKFAHLNDLVLQGTYKETINLGWLKKNCPDIRSIDKERELNGEKAGNGYMPPVGLIACDYADGIKN